MTWQDILAGRIRAAGDVPWEVQTVTVPGGGVYDRRVKRFRVPMGNVPGRVLLPFLGGVNGREFAGEAPGRIMLEGWSEYPVYEPFIDGVEGLYGSTAVFAVSDRDWNEFVRPDGTWEVMRDADGKTPFPAIDFSALPVVDGQGEGGTMRTGVRWRPGPASGGDPDDRPTDQAVFLFRGARDLIAGALMGDEGLISGGAFSFGVKTIAKSINHFALLRWENVLWWVPSSDIAPPGHNPWGG